MKDAFYFVCPELSKHIPNLIAELLRVCLLQKMVDPRFRGCELPLAETFAVHPIVAEPLQKLVAKNEQQKIYLQIGRYFERLGDEISFNPLDHEMACDYYWQAKLAEELLFRRLQYFWERSGQYAKMITFSEKAKDHSDSQQGKAKADHLKATALMNQGHYQQALQLFEDVLKQRKEIGDRAGIGETLGQIGAIYFYNRMFKDAFEFYYVSMLIFKQVGRSTYKQSIENLEIVGKKLSENIIKNIIEKVRNNLAAGQLPEIVPLKS